jgi:hypothetical protein
LTSRLQANIYAANRTFTSFKQMVRQLQSSAMLVSLHSTSKGFVGECGRRGGYMEVVNFPAGELPVCVVNTASVCVMQTQFGMTCSVWRQDLHEGDAGLSARKYIVASVVPASLTGMCACCSMLRPAG